MKPSEESNVKDDDSIIDELSYVEFYSGVGGWTMALEEALTRLPSEKSGRKRRLRRIAALDHSDLCTRVFEHNFGTDKKSFQIERLTLKQVEEWKANVWAMSPPCQPHTRQHANQEQDLNDPRSASFLHLCGLLEGIKEQFLPSLLLLENVIGFESSNSFVRWREVLADRQYHVGHFHLTPTQVGLPNDRPRYYCVAVRTAALENSSALSPLLSYLQPDIAATGSAINISKALQEMDINEASTSGKTFSDLPPISSFLDDKPVASLRVPDKVLSSNAAWCFDIVTPNDQRSACFTSSYGNYNKGTGSVLYEDSSRQIKLEAPEERKFNESWADDLDLSKLRYFSGTEMAQLMGFREDFAFPSDCSTKQQWKLLGNSLNVRLAARLVEFGLRLTRLRKA
jgi:tRNA (cytosine38-C5)-methyltransferase